MILVSYIPSAFSRTLKDLRNYIQGKKAFGSLWLRLFFHLPQSGVFSYKMHRVTFATRRSLTCNFFICSYRSQISINFSRTNFHRDKSEVSLPIIKFLYSHIPRKICANTLRHLECDVCLKRSRAFLRGGKPMDLPVRKDNRRIAGNGWFPLVSRRSSWWTSPLIL